MTCPQCKIPMSAVQYVLTPEDYDGTSEFQCDECHLRIGRWTGAVLKDGELEPRYGLKRTPHDSPAR